MKNRIGLLFLAFILISTVASAERVFNARMTISKDDSVTVSSFEVLEGKASSFPEYPDANYLIKIVSFDGRTLFEAPMKIDFVVHPFPEGEIELNETERSFRLPFFADAKRIEMYHDGRLIHSLNIADYLCNNNSICDANENADNCPSDCRQTTTTTVPQQGSSNILMLVVGITLLVIGIVTLYILIRRRNESREAEILRKRRL